MSCAVTNQPSLNRIRLAVVQILSMITHLFLLFPLLLGAVLLYNVFCLGANYVNARKLGLPVVASPISPDNPLWLALQTSFSRLFRRLPFAATSFTRYCQLGWEFHDRFRTHLSLGDAWILVTPAKNWLYVANEKAVTEIFSRSRDFVRPVWMLGMPLRVSLADILISQ